MKNVALSAHDENTLDAIPSRGKPQKFFFEYVSCVSFAYGDVGRAIIMVHDSYCVIILCRHTGCTLNGNINGVV